MPPIRAGVPIIDRTTALHASIGTLAALRERDISGQGQTIDVCLADTGYSYTEIPISAYHGAGVQPRRDSAGNMFPCKDGWVLITAETNTTGRGCAKLWETRVARRPALQHTPRAPARMLRLSARAAGVGWPT